MMSRGSKKLSRGDVADRSAGDGSGGASGGGVDSGRESSHSLHR